MSAVLVLADGPVMIEIPDAKGQVHEYRVEPCRPGLDHWAVLVRHVGDDGTPAYRVAVDRRGQWACGCKDWRYRHSRQPEDEGCKHTSALKWLYGVIQQLEGKHRWSNGG